MNNSVDCLYCPKCDSVTSLSGDVTTCTCGACSATKPRGSAVGAIDVHGECAMILVLPTKELHERYEYCSKNPKSTTAVVSYFLSRDSRRTKREEE